MFKALVKKVCLALENCGNLTTDEDVQDALCKAAEEIGRKVLPNLNLLCGPGYTPLSEPTPATTYTVTYNGNINTGGAVPIDANHYEQGATVTVLGQGSIAKTNFTFIEWNTEAGGGGTAYDPADTFSMPASDVTLYAQWTENTKYNVIYNANGGTGSQTDSLSPYYAGVEVIVLGKGDMAKANYTFDGWSTTPGGAVAYDPADTFSMPASDVTLYAQWECNPCSPDGWSAAVTVEKWWSDAPGNSGPRVDIFGDINPPNCLTGDITITLRLELFNAGWTSKGTTGNVTLTLPSGNPFVRTFGFGINIDNASYNSIKHYKLEIKPDGCCDWIVIKSGDVSVK
jgi:uncharacterized repeat protein (TIGR02543 family)